MRGRNQFLRGAVLVMLGALLTLPGKTSTAAVPGLINLQGILKDASDNPLPDASYPVTFRIYDASVGGALLWGEVSSVTTTDGLFTTNLGSVTPVPDTTFNNPDLWLEIQVQGFAAMSPRTRLTSVAYANETAQWNSVGSNLSRMSGNVGLGTTNPQSRLHVVSSAIDVPPRLQSSGTTGFAAGWDFYNGATPKGYVGVGDPAASFAADELLLFGSTGIKTSLWAGGTRALSIDLDGNVGIGGLPSAHKLNVETGLPAAVRGLTTFVSGIGVVGVANNGPSAYGIYGTSLSGLAGAFSGHVSVSGTLTKGGGAFKIDHPTDPANKYLYHSFVESPDMMNIYNGNVALDSKGEAVIALPDWFGALNKDFRYQLTCIGGFAQIYVAEKVKDNHFKIAGGSAGLEVSWQVTGIRQDAYANTHRIPVEETKPEKERGFYLHPGLFSQPEEKQIEWARRPEMMKQMKEQREKATDK